MLGQDAIKDKQSAWRDQGRLGPARCDGATFEVTANGTVVATAPPGPPVFLPWDRICGTAGAPVVEICVTAKLPSGLTCPPVCCTVRCPVCPCVLDLQCNEKPDGVEVTGTIDITLYVSSDVRDTDFTVKLVDVYPDGRAYNIDETILRARYREGFDREVFMEEGEVYELNLSPLSTSNFFGPTVRK